MRYNKRQRIGSVIVTIIAIYPMCRLWFGLPIWLSAITSVLSLVVLLLSFHFEKKSNTKFDKIKENIKNGGHATADDEETFKARYEEFLEKDGFHTVTAGSMKTDLFRQYTRPSGYFMTLFGIIVAAVSLILFHGMDGVDIVCALFGLGFVVYGVCGIFPKNLRKIRKTCGDRYGEINDSYMNGRVLKFKRTVNNEYVNSVLNIGERYVIASTIKGFYVIDRGTVADVTNRLIRTKFYGDGLYTGTAFTSRIEIHTTDDKRYHIPLSDLQAHLACDVLTRHDAALNASTGDRMDDSHF